MERPAVVTIPRGEPTIRCKCGSPAIGVYIWTTKSFGRVKENSDRFCASCALEIPNKIRMFTPKDGDGTPVFYKPNSTAVLVTRFQYLEPLPMKPSGRVSEYGQRMVIRRETGAKEITTNAPRVWCEKCNTAREPVISILRTRHMHRNGVEFVRERRIAHCSVCHSETTLDNS